MPLQSASYAIFVLAVLGVFYALPKVARRAFLLIASAYFYAAWNAWYVVLLAALALSDWAIGLAIERSEGPRRGTLLALGVGANLAFLGSFKYVNFVTATIAALAGLHASPFVSTLLVPIGISFHTFQSISYLVDVSRRRIPARRSLADYALYLAFFPQLLAGPIVRAGRFFDELDNWTAPGSDDVARGVREIAQGLVKKAVLADAFAPVADRYFGAIGAHPPAAAAWSGVLAFSWQIYFDFSGYSDIAIGTARLFGFAFPPNFLRPYFASDLREFWQRWHVSLSSWLRDYLYIPLGGSRFGTLATARNLTITMLLGGLWHGASLTFVAWGGYHGAWLVAGRLRRDLRERFAPPVAAEARVTSTFLPYARRLAGIVTTFGIVTAGWVLFRATSFADAWTTYGALFSATPGPGLLDGWTLTLACAGFGAEAIAACGRLPAFARAGALVQGSAIAALVLVLELCAAGGPARAFVYFKF